MRSRATSVIRQRIAAIKGVQSYLFLQLISSPFASSFLILSMSPDSAALNSGEVRLRGGVFTPSSICSIVTVHFSMIVGKGLTVIPVCSA